MPNGHATGTREGETVTHGNLDAGAVLSQRRQPLRDGVKVTTFSPDGRIVAADVPYAEWIASGGDPPTLSPDRSMR